MAIRRHLVCTKLPGVMLTTHTYRRPDLCVETSQFKYLLFYYFRFGTVNSTECIRSWAISDHLIILSLHIAISVQPGTHLHLSQVKHVRNNLPTVSLTMNSLNVFFMQTRDVGQMLALLLQRWLSYKPILGRCVLFARFAYWFHSTNFLTSKYWSLYFMLLYS